MSGATSAIQKKEIFMKRKKLVLIIITVTVLIGTARYFRDDASGASHAAAAPRAAVPVKSAVAMRGNLDLSLNVVARTEAWSTVTVHARNSGQLKSLGFTPGATVKKGDLLAQLDPLPFQAQLDQAIGNVAKDRAQFEKAQADLQRYSQVVAKGYISRADFDAYQANVGVTRATLQTDRAAQEWAQLQLSYTRITAPFDGVVGLPQVWPGAEVTANSTDIVVINQIEPLRISFSVPEANLTAIRTELMHGPVTVQAKLPGDSSAPLQAQLEFIDNTVDVNTSTIVLKGRLENIDGRLTPGQFMQVSIPTEHLINAVSMPAQALQSSDKGDFVFVIGADGKAHQRFVDTGPTTEGRMVITQGLQPGERVVTDGQLSLSDGSLVRVADGT
jgi:multidrug efflux system membrane fusion protein